MLFVKLKLWIKQFLERDSLTWRALKTLYQGVNEAQRLKGSLGTLPDFLIIGVQKGGTTSLYHYLIQHPDVYGAVNKEITYFTQADPKPIRWYRSHFPLRLTRRLHEAKGNPFRTGEASTDYLHKPFTAERVKAVLPDVKIIVLLRNPVDRAYSHYNHMVRNNKEDIPFREALDNENDRIRGEKQKILEDPSYQSYHYHHHTYRERGKYVEFLKPWYERFGDDQIRVVKSENLFQQPKQTTNNVFEFLGVDPYELDEYHQINKGEYDEIDDDLRAELEAFYEPYNDELEELIGRDMHWF